MRDLREISTSTLCLDFSEENLDKFAKVSEKAKSLGRKLYPYVIVATERNIDLLSKIGQPYVTLDRLELFLTKIKHLVNGIIVSCPKDRRGLIKALHAAKRI